MKVACIGEAMVELSLDRSGRTAGVGHAGDTLNTAIYLKRAAPALEVSYVTRLGRDDFSARLRDFIAAEDLLVDDIEVSNTRQIGLYAITTDARGERSFTYWRSASAAREMFQTDKGADFSALDKFDLLYFSAISLAILPAAVRSEFYKWLPGFRARGGLVSFDSNYRPALWTDRATAKAEIAQMWQMTDIALPSVDDEMAAFGDNSVQDVTERLRGCGIKCGALKCGSGGPVSLGEAVKDDYSPADVVVDTTAAGDSFNGGYLAAFLTGKGQAASLRAGHDLASHVVGIKGAIAPR